MNSFTKFWMVFGPAGAPSVKHYTEEAAFKEAKRLAATKSGEFIVLEAVGGFAQAVTPFVALAPS